MKKIRFQSQSMNYPKGIVGESQYQTNIANIAGFYDDGEKRYREDGLAAELHLEDDNKFDLGNAVRVDIEGKTVGYLSSTDAAKYRKEIKKLGLGEIIGVCGAAIAGKRESAHEDMNFGVFIDLDLKPLKVQVEKPRIQPAPVAVIAPPKVENKEAEQIQKTTPKPFIQNIVETWNKGLIEKIGLIIMALLILNFIFQVFSAAITQ